MDTKEKHVRENESSAKREVREAQDRIVPDQADRLEIEGEDRKRDGRGRVNRLWLWLGVLVLVFILLYWLFTIGVFGDLQSWFNG